MFSGFLSPRTSTDSQKIAEILNRGVEDVFIRESLEKKLLSGKQLRIKFGIDPTGPNIHIGRAVVLRKLRAFQDLGHKIVCIVGDFTAQIGDPSDKLEKRPMLSSSQIGKNAHTYRAQIGKILDISKTEFRFNSEWLAKLGFSEIMRLAEMFSVGQMIERRNFKERYEKGEEISLREFLYPLIQGFDSVVVKADVEIGGFDQLFNLKAGRVVLKHHGLPEQDVLTISMLPGTDGRKMSTSWGNVINITDEPSDMFGKVMSVSDELIEQYFLLCTDVASDEVKMIGDSIKNKTANPRDQKIRLAREIVTLYYDKEKAARAEREFLKVFTGKGVPDDVVSVEVKKGELLSDVLLRAGLVSSKTEWRRLAEDGAVFDMDHGQKITDINEKIKSNTVIKVGKRRFVKIILT
ncbi:MAG: tyrosine--tRNA ligase [Patescibacteria group bacterium]|nr:tyrosine--tRNA ligase [bacterium]MDZ4240969.1 tyrosine--tRNA ligase [Patescibacteria group bacterium]